MLAALVLYLNPPLKGDVVQPFILADPAGAVFEWKPGRTTVLCAFAYWCDTWKTQRLRLLEAQGKTKGLPVDFYAVSVDGQWQDVDKNAPWSRRLVDVGSRWTKSLGIDRVPYTLVIDPSGTVTWAGYGIARSNDIVREVQSDLDASPIAEKVVYLTFDDFPAASGDAELLDVLRKYEVKASFFVIGDDAEERPEWVSRAFREGHQLDVHGWHHTVPDSDPARCRDWIRNKTGQEPHWWRSPGSNVIQDFDGKAFAAPEIDPYDFLRPGAAELQRRIFGRLKPGATIHLHAGVRDSIEALPAIIERARSLGYRFELLP